jgi:hypothetical protein
MKKLLLQLHEVIWADKSCVSYFPRLWLGNYETWTTFISRHYLPGPVIIYNERASGVVHLDVIP